MGFARSHSAVACRSSARRARAGEPAVAEGGAELIAGDGQDSAGQGASLKTRGASGSAPALGNPSQADAKPKDASLPQRFTSRHSPLSDSAMRVGSSMSRARLVRDGVAGFTGGTLLGASRRRKLVSNDNDRVPAVGTASARARFARLPARGGRDVVRGHGDVRVVYAVQGLLPTLAAQFGVAASTSSLVLSATTLTLALAIVPLSAVAESWGRTRVMTVALGAAAVLGLAAPLAPSFELLVLLRGLQGIALAALPALAMAHVTREVAPVTSAARWAC